MGKPKLKTMLKGKSPARTQSGKRPLERCSTKGTTQNGVFINGNNGKYPEVVIIDIPDSCKKRAQSSRLSPKSIPFVNFISIDDDELDAQDASQVDGSHDSFATTNQGSCPAFNESKNSNEADYDDCQIIREKRFPLTFSKSKRTYSDETLSRNRFGLFESSLSESDSSSSEGESSSSESDSSDCEFMEGPSGEIREQWERAAMKRKMSDNGESSFDDQVHASGTHGDTPKSVGVENTAGKHVEEPIFSNSKTASDKTVNPSTSIKNGDNATDARFGEMEEDDPVVGAGKAVEDSPLSSQGSPQEEAQFSYMKDKVNTSMGQPMFSDPDMRGDTGDPSLQASKGQFPGGPFWSSYQGIETNYFHVEPCWLNTESTSYRARESFKDDDLSPHNSNNYDEIYGDLDKFNPQDNGGDVHQNSTSRESKLENSIDNERANVSYNKVQVTGYKPCKQTQLDDGDTYLEENEPIYEDFVACKSPLESENETTRENIICQDKEKSRPGISCLSNAPVNHEILHFNIEQDPATQPVISPPLSNQDGNVVHDIIGERERFKETVEFKLAAEEEWAARQRQLHIQAEEAKRLRKRIKAEALRTQDMERRQKQRLEEMRETQKKNVETINLKEQLRGEIRKELVRLELMHTNMASLLRGLGITVAGGVYPSSQEVHAAYKQALLRFHPDRASKTNIRQQVEAEEKFKLISRLKEKLLPISWF